MTPPEPNGLQYLDELPGLLWKMSGSIVGYGAAVLALILPVIFRKRKILKCEKDTPCAIAKGGMGL